MGRWSTGLPPKECGLYIVTVEYLHTRFVAMAERTENPAGNFYWLYQYGGTIRGNVVAWQKAPTPYHKHK